MAAKGTSTIVPVWLVTAIVVDAICVRESGNPSGKCAVVYNRTVTDCAPLIASALSRPKETEVMSYSWELAKLAMLKARQ
jgi:hypothetical protein